MKTLFTFILCAMCLNAQAAIQWFSQQPEATTLLDSDIFAIERASPQGYRKIYATNIPQTILLLYGDNFSITTNGNTYTIYLTNNAGATAYYTNVYINSNYINVSFTTNLYVTVEQVYQSYVTNLTVVSNAYFFETNFVNYNITTNLSVISNAYFYQTNFVNYEIVTNLTVISNAYFYETNFVSYSYITNLTVVNTNVAFWTITTNLIVYSNAYFFETNFVNYSYTTNIIINKAYITEVYVNTGTFTNNAFFLTNAWAGATNTLPLWLASQDYLAFTPCSVTNISGVSNNVVEHVLLTITNAASTNITLYLPAQWRTGDGARSYVITNAGVGLLSVEYNPNGGRTNAIFRFVW